MKSNPLSAESVFAGLAALAAERTDRRRRRLSIGEQAVLRKARKRQAKLRRLAVWKARQAKEKASKPKGVKCAAPFGEAHVHRMVAAMEPGVWYGMRDISRQVSDDRRVSGKVLQVMMPKGYVRRRENPRYRGFATRQDVSEGTAEPMYVYQLTECGEALRDAVRMLQ